jgi:uncharacterized protein GlcG (DUF336 family)
MRFFIFLILINFSSNAFSAEKGYTELNLETAQQIGLRVFDCGKKNNWNFSIAIVNSEGNLIYFQRGDGAYVGSIDASLDKAKSANAFQRPTKAFADGIKDGRIGLVTVKNVVGIEGGLPIVFGAKHVGAIGVSGAKATEDEQCAKSALE